MYRRMLISAALVILACASPPAQAQRLATPFASTAAIRDSVVLRPGDAPPPAWSRLALGWTLGRGDLLGRHDAWGTADVTLAAAFLTTLWVDAAQTRAFARGGWHGFRETNPLLGPRPGVGQINAYTAAAGLATLGVAAVLPARARRRWLAAALAVELYTVAHTTRMGAALTVR